MTPRVLILHGGQEATRLELARHAGKTASILERLRAGDSLVMSDSEPALALPETLGVVFGEIFGRAELRRVKLLPLPAAQSLAASGGRRLIENYWGDYLAVLLAQDGVLHLVRSPFGTMSAYRLKVRGVEVVCSEVGLLIDLGWLAPTIDWPFTAHFLAHPFRRARRTGFVGVTELPPGGALTWSGGRSADERVLWSPWDHVRPQMDGGYADVLRPLVRRSVRAWADGRQHLLLELSGGLDSSVLAACLWDVSAKVTCVNMVSPARDGDERIYAQAAAQKFGLSLEEIELLPGELDLTASPAIRRPRPSAHALLGPWDRTLGDRAAALGVDAFISGGGGDNVFFNTHGSAPASDALRRGAVGTWAEAVKDLAMLHGCSVWRAGAMSVRRMTAPASGSWKADPRFLSPRAAEMPAEPHPWLEDLAGAAPGKVEHVKGLMGAQNYLDAFPRSGRAPLLTPLLSQPIVEFCLSVPSWEWIRQGQERSVTRKAFRGVLPDLVIDRRTKGNLAGFAGPAFEAARGRLADHLLGGRLDEAGLLDAPSLRAALSETGPPKGSDYFRILQIADVESWVRRWA